MVLRRQSMAKVPRRTEAGDAVFRPMQRDSGHERPDRPTRHPDQFSNRPSKTTLLISAKTA